MDTDTSEDGQPSHTHSRNASTPRLFTRNPHASQNLTDRDEEGLVVQDGRIVKASDTKLIELLTGDDALSSLGVSLIIRISRVHLLDTHVFLMTYRLYITPEKLFALIRARIDGSESTQVSGPIHTTVTGRCLLLLQKWLEVCTITHFDDI